MQDSGGGGSLTLSFSSFAQQARLRPQKHPCFPGILRGDLQLSGAPPIPAHARRLSGRRSWPKLGLPCRIAGRRIVGTATCRGIGCQGSRGRSGGGLQARSNPHRRGAKSVPVSFARLERESRLLVVGRTSPYPQARLLAGADDGRGRMARCSAHGAVYRTKMSLRQRASTANASGLRSMSWYSSMRAA